MGSVVDPRFVYDTFTDSDGVLLENHTGEIGATWVKHPNYTSGSACITGNRVRRIANNPVYYSTTLPASADQDIRANLYVVTNAGEAWIMGRTSLVAATFYSAIRNVTQKKWYLLRKVAGSDTDLAVSAADAGYAEGATIAMRLTVQGAGATVALRLYANDSLVLSYDDTAATRITANGYVCLLPTGSGATTGWHISDFEARNL